MKVRSILGLIVSLAITSQSVFTQSLAVESKRDKDGNVEFVDH